MALEELLADDSAFRPETRIVLLVAFVPVGIDEVLQDYQVLSCGLQKDHNLVIVARQRQRLKGKNAAFVRHSVLRKHLLLDDEVDGSTNIRVQH